MPGNRDPNPRLLEYARRMRREPTDAEKKLWYVLRGGRMGFHFRRQVPIAEYIADFYCVAASIIVEADGGQHYEPRQRQYDAERTEAFGKRGIRVLRFS